METQLTTDAHLINFRNFRKQLDTSNESWSLSLSEITLHPDFGGFINHFLGRKEHIHMVSIAWDYSGMNPTIYPRLNFTFTKQPFLLNPGNPKPLSNRTLFAQKKVVDSLNVALFFFKSKNGGSVKELIDLLESHVNLSLLSQKLTSLNPDTASEKKKYMNYVYDALCLNLAELIKKSESKYITTIQFSYPVEDEWNYYGDETLMKDGVRIQLTKNKI